MSGTREGNAKVVITLKQKYGDDYFKRIGAVGGKKSIGGGFAAGEEGRARARVYGAIGGKLGKRGPCKPGCTCGLHMNGKRYATRTSMERPNTAVASRHDSNSSHVHSMGEAE